jgi:hypothetical protein
VKDSGIKRLNLPFDRDDSGDLYNKSLCGYRSRMIEFLVLLAISRYS